MIPHKTLRCGFSLPVLGLGTWLMGGTKEREPSAQDQQDVIAIKEAIAAGYTHIDSAEIYADGYSEELLGQALVGTDRKKLTLASKVSRAHQSYDDLLTALDGSLHRVGTDYFDIYYLHFRSPDVAPKETAKALNKAVADGRIRHVAVANFTPQRLDEMQSYLDTKIVANQVHYNLVFREPERYNMFNHAVEKDYFVMAWRPLRLRRRIVEQDAVLADMWERGFYPSLDAVADRNHLSNTQAALNWIASKPNTVTLTKSSHVTRLAEAAAAFNVTLSAQDIQALDQSTPQFETSNTVPLE